MKEEKIHWYPEYKWQVCECMCSLGPIPAMTCVATPLLRGGNEGTSVSVSRVFSSAVMCNVFCDNSRRRDQQLYITPRLLSVFYLLLPRVLSQFL